MDQLLDVAPDADASASPPNGVRVRGGKRFEEIPSRDQLSFEVRRIQDFVPEGDRVRVIDELVDQLDFSALEAAHPGGGRPAFAPKFLAKQLIFGYTLGIRSAREISRRVDYDVRFKWLASERRVDHRTLSHFRRQFHEALKDIFRQTVHLGVLAGLVSLRLVAVDGTKIAAAAKRRTLGPDALEKALRHVDEQIEQLLREGERLDAEEDAALGEARGDEVPPELAKAKTRREKLLEAKRTLQQSGQGHVSLTDPEAPVQKTGDGKRPGYNGQLAVDGDSGVIVGQDLTDAQDDTQQLAPMVEQVTEHLGLLPDTLPADAGYQSAETLTFIEKWDLNAYLGQRPPPAQERYGHEAFGYDSERDTYVCPVGATLVFKKIKTLHEDPYRLYRASSRDCRHCPQRARCITEKSPVRELLIATHDALVQAMRQKSATEAGREALQLRAQTVEPTFGTIKAVLGLRQFLLRGLRGAQTEFGLCAIAMNLRKVAHWRLAGGDGALLRLAWQAA